MDAPDPTPVAKQHLLVREGGDIDLGMLDQEAFARVIASGQQSQSSLNRGKSVDDEDDENDSPEQAEDIIYHPSGVLSEGADPIWTLRMTCLPVLDIIVCSIDSLLIVEHGTVKDIVVTSTFDNPSDCHRLTCIPN
jgi:hypothetical protein